MPAIRIVLVEDDWIIAKEIAFSLQDLGFEVAGTTDNGEEAVELVRRLQPDLVLLDIDLAGEQSGIDVGRQLRATTNIPFIFLTALADSQTVLQAKLVSPYGYLVKPVNPASLYSTIEITLHNAHQRKEAALAPVRQTPLAGDSIFVKTKSRLERLQLKEVLWVEAADIYAVVCTGSGKHLLNVGLKTVEEKLPADRFLRVHRSYIVNLERIEALEEDRLLIQGHSLPVGKTYREQLMARLSFL